MTIRIDKGILTRMGEAQAQMTDLAKTLESLSIDLDTVVTEARDEISERSERWQEGDRGAAVNEWIDNVEAFAEQLGEVSDLLTDAADSIANLETKP